MKNFRPHCLVLTGPPQDRPNLTYLVSQFTKKDALMVCADVIRSPFGRLVVEEAAHAKWIRTHKIKAFSTLTTGEYTKCTLTRFSRLLTLV